MDGGTHQQRAEHEYLLATSKGQPFFLPAHRKQKWGQLRGQQIGLLPNGLVEGCGHPPNAVLFLGRPSQRRTDPQQLRHYGPAPEQCHRKLFGQIQRPHRVAHFGEISLGERIEPGGQVEQCKIGQRSLFAVFAVDTNFLNIHQLVQLQLDAVAGVGCSHGRNYHRLGHPSITIACTFYSNGSLAQWLTKQGIGFTERLQEITFGKRRAGLEQAEEWVGEEWDGGKVELGAGSFVGFPVFVVGQVIGAKVFKRQHGFHAATYHVGLGIFEFIQNIKSLKLKHQKRIPVYFGSNYIHHSREVLARHRIIGTRAAHAEVIERARKQPNTLFLGKIDQFLG